jgi:hypothetical protein
LAEGELTTVAAEAESFALPLSKVDEALMVAEVLTVVAAVGVALTTTFGALPVASDVAVQVTVFALKPQTHGAPVVWLL